MLYSLPALRITVEKAILECRAEIAKLPPVSNVHPSTEVMLRVTAFSKDVHDAVFGIQDKNFVQTSRGIYSEFKEAIMMTTPDFRPVESSSSGRSLVSTKTEPRDLAFVRQVIKE